MKLFSTDNHYTTASSFLSVVEAKEAILNFSEGTVKVL